MPIIFRFKGFEIRFWYRFEEKRMHIHAISDEVNIKIWLEPEIELASIKGNVNESLISEIIKEVKANEQLCKNKWREYLGE
ncbi:MAG: DUF4160 domain-containing protein [Victivallales bacterium]|jgi:hypothetical protein|nr:DUF4160 domain-containing protein [Victivallales bacterium]